MTFFLINLFIQRVLSKDFTIILINVYEVIKELESIRAVQRFINFVDRENNKNNKEYLYA